MNSTHDVTQVVKTSSLETFTKQMDDQLNQIMKEYNEENEKKSKFHLTIQ